ncbi:hypothetical protein I6I18_11695 [Kytococcus sedentarius]|uniref:hypothetical protein n=1 Tax=Kytococcus sedentarius TaxID=1276 RepID=UPI000E02C58B|nr:hypothetical protein [Kytococcus sedentarius]QQB63656.1 hypothetical protein I6I18_11695 [Kytococcus sedentarius]STX13403.1 Uncharacterised protein [Kytococcus sedentarius]
MRPRIPRPQRLGRMWERAQVRLEMDLASGARPYGIVAGDHPVPELLRPFLP